MVLGFVLLAISLAEDLCLSDEGGTCSVAEFVDEEDFAVGLLQTRTFLERPPLSVDEGMQVELHAVELKGEPQQEEEHGSGPTNEGALFAAKPGSLPLHGAPDHEDGPAWGAKEAGLLETGSVITHTAGGEDAATIVFGDAVAAAPKAAGLLETRAVVSHADGRDADHEDVPAAAGATASGLLETSGQTAGAAKTVQGPPPAVGLDPDHEDGGVVDADAGFAGLVGPAPELSPHGFAKKTVDLSQLATLIGEAAVLLVGELCRRFWVSGVAVEASGVVPATATAEAGSVGMLVFGFPVTLWLIHRCFGKKGETLLGDSPLERNPFAEATSVAPEEEEKSPAPGQGCVLETVGCALEHAAGAEGETVHFRSLAINATGLAYTALGRPTSSGRWRVELLDRRSSRDPANVGPAPKPALDDASVLLGVLPDPEVPGAADDLAGQWPFVSAARGRGFAYSPAGCAVRRGAETPCSAAEVDAVLELALDAPRRAFEVFCLPREPDALPELLCSFVGIRPGAYRLAISLRSGGVRVTDVSERESS